MSVKWTLVVTVAVCLYFFHKHAPSITHCFLLWLRLCFYGRVNQEQMFFSHCQQIQF